MNAEFSFQPGPIFETNSPLDFNIFHPVDGKFGTLLQDKPDARTHEVHILRRHILLKPRKLTEPNTEDNTNPREQWDGKTIDCDKLPEQQVGRQKYPTPDGKFVSKTSFLIINVKFTHPVVVTANKFRTHATS